MKEEEKYWATTDDVKEMCDHIVKEHKYSGEARVEVFIEGQDEKRYGIVKIGHYHFIPNMTLTIEEITDGKAR